MLNIIKLCNTNLPLRSYTPVKQFFAGTCRQNVFYNSNRLLFTTQKGSKLTISNFRISQKISNVLRSNVVIFSTNATPKPKNGKLVGYWLAGCTGMVFGAVVLGGVTRLTESGLSMVTWKLLGERLPRSQNEWQEEFEKYQQFPEYKIKNQSLTLTEFKFIWWMEYGHRMWGRAIGAALFIPAVFFWTRGYLNKGMKVRVGAYCALVAAQGLMGWYMVKSGLEDRFHGPSDVPRVSQYRLAAHLSLAFILYSGLLAGSLRMLRPFPGGGLQKKVPQLMSMTMLAHTVKALVFFTAVSGAFVAGLDAGLVYNSFPKMADKWIPDDILAFSPTIKNFTENPTTVQFDHRVLGTLTLAAASALWLISRKKALSPVARRVVNTLGAVAWIQVGLGITTLLTYVPTTIAASHQSGSLMLLTLAIWLTHEIKLLKFIPK